MSDEENMCDGGGHQENPAPTPPTPTPPSSDPSPTVSPDPIEMRIRLTHVNAFDPNPLVVDIDGRFLRGLCDSDSWPAPLTEMRLYGLLQQEIPPHLTDGRIYTATLYNHLIPPLLPPLPNAILYNVHVQKLVLVPQEVPDPQSRPNDEPRAKRARPNLVSGASAQPDAETSDCDAAAGSAEISSRPRRPIQGTPVFDEEASGYKVVVFGLTSDANSDSLREKFVEAGGVVKDAFIPSGKDKGFITFEDTESGQKAADAVNDTDWNGKKLSVKWNSPKRESDR